ncbi:MAG: type I-E CRISPR-associated protein Cas6/Cse3/CasE [Neomegalonema sp.]|nr:type I-E CRISPR-associated protein Cas6/Cse3/CasE [Neomegalonema sp.]
MMGFNLLRSNLSVPGLHRWARGRHCGVHARGIDEGRALHHLLDECFGPGALRPFRLQVSRGGATLTACTDLAPTELSARFGRYALPEILAVLDPGSMAVRSVVNDWQVGEMTGIELVTRPERRLTNGGTADACPDPEADLAVREAHYAQWLDERLGGAARLEYCQLRRYRRMPVLRSGSRRMSPMKTGSARSAAVSFGPEARLYGEVRIEDSAAFFDLLRHGLGRHRGYGYGLVLPRPVAREVMPARAASS